MIGYSRLDAWPDDESGEEEENTKQEGDYYDDTDTERTYWKVSRGFI